jgi:hypothetical protein
LDAGTERGPAWRAYLSVRRSTGERENRNHGQQSNCQLHAAPPRMNCWASHSGRKYPHGLCQLHPQVALSSYVAALQDVGGNHGQLYLLKCITIFAEIGEQWPNAYT